MPKRKYKFNELSSEVKKEVLKRYRYIMVEDYAGSIYIEYAVEACFVNWAVDNYLAYIKLKFKEGEETVLSSIKKICRDFDREEGIYKLAKEYYDEIIRYFKEDEEIQEFMQAQKCPITILDMKIDEFIEYYPDSMLEHITLLACR